MKKEVIAVVVLCLGILFSAGIVSAAEGSVYISGSKLCGFSCITYSDCFEGICDNGVCGCPGGYNCTTHVCATNGSAEGCSILDECNEGSDCLSGVCSVDCTCVLDLGCQPSDECDESSDCGLNEACASNCTCISLGSNETGCQPTDVCDEDLDCGSGYVCSSECACVRISSGGGGGSGGSSEIIYVNNGTGNATYYPVYMTGEKEVVEVQGAPVTQIKEVPTYVTQMINPLNAISDAVGGYKNLVLIIIFSVAGSLLAYGAHNKKRVIIRARKKKR